jgi:hypothetical protein
VGKKRENVREQKKPEVLLNFVFLVAKQLRVRTKNAIIYLDVKLFQTSSIHFVRMDHTRKSLQHSGEIAAAIPKLVVHSVICPNDQCSMFMYVISVSGLWVFGHIYVTMETIVNCHVEGCWFVLYQ